MWDVTQEAKKGEGENPKGVFAYPDPENSGGTNFAHELLYIGLRIKNKPLFEKAVQM